MLASMVQLVRREAVVPSNQVVLRVVETVPVASVLMVPTLAVYWVGRIGGSPRLAAPAAMRVRVAASIARGSGKLGSGKRRGAGWVWTLVVDAPCAALLCSGRVWGGPRDPRWCLPGKRFWP